MRPADGGLWCRTAGRTASRPGPGISPGNGEPRSRVTLQGFGFVFLTLHFGRASPAFIVNGNVTISTVVPELGEGGTLVGLYNVDGHASTHFDVPPPPTTTST